MHSDELYHYGVKGMKWGVRKREPSSGTRRKSSNKPNNLQQYNMARKQKAQAKDKPSFDSKKGRKAVLKDLRSLSNEDIRKYTTRLNDEKNLKRLLKDDVSPAHRTLNKITDAYGDQVIKPLAVSAGKYATHKALKSIAKGKPYEEAVNQILDMANNSGGGDKKKKKK